MTVRIDLNADLGESFGTWVLGDDEAMLDVVTSANVACGFHAGDATTIRRTVAAAARRGVVVGAQVGYRDLAGFGRRRIDMDAGDLTADVLYQLGALEAMCRVAGTRVAYVKPHGALYTTAAVDEVQARAVVDAVAAYDSGLGAAAGRVVGRAAGGGRGVRRSRVRRRRAARASLPPAGPASRSRRGCRAGAPDRF
jgi:5-oxoprolinase (ATP-hydrolysing) subunit A